MQSINKDAGKYYLLIIKIQEVPFCGRLYLQESILAINRILFIPNLGLSFQIILSKLIEFKIVDVVLYRNTYHRLCSRFLADATLQVCCLSYHQLFHSQIIHSLVSQIPAFTDRTTHVTFTESQHPPHHISKLMLTFQSETVFPKNRHAVEETFTCALP